MRRLSEGREAERGLHRLDCASPVITRRGPRLCQVIARSTATVILRTAQDLILRLQPALVPAQLNQLGLLRTGPALPNPVIDLGLTHPATHRLLGDTKVDRDLRHRQITPTGNRGHVLLELRRVLLRHSDILPEDPRPSKAMSTQPAADPFDVRSDANGKDPDTHSPTLRRYHKALWSKPLPSGRAFDLDTTTRGACLHHRSELGEFWLSSDSVIPTFSRWIALKPVLERLPVEEIESFRAIGYTVGGMRIFPGNVVDGKQTINGARGFLRKIADRMDLTLECIRRHYLGQASPLESTLARYADFFELFGDFTGYVDFFLLQDLVTDDGTAVRFFMPFDDFTTSSVPRYVGVYRAYRLSSTAFVEARNCLIDHLELHPS